MRTFVKRYHEYNRTRIYSDNILVGYRMEKGILQALVTSFVMKLIIDIYYWRLSTGLMEKRIFHFAKSLCGNGGKIND